MEQEQREVDVPTLREMGFGEKYFWQDSGNRVPLARDQHADYAKRPVPENARAVLGLNEVAAHLREGFLYFVPPRDTWKKHADSKRLPEGRRPLPARDDMPTLLYMMLQWDDANIQRFYKQSYRARYLNCNILINPPPPETPLYAIQYVSFKTCPTYITSHESLVLYAVDLMFYLVPLSKCIEILGRYSRDKQKVNTAPFLWEPAILDKPNSGNQKKQNILLQQYRARGLEELHKRMTELCMPSSASTDLLAGHLQKILPRPSADKARLVGVALGQGASAEPPSKRGISFGKSKDPRPTKRAKSGSPSAEAHHSEDPEAVDLF